MSFCFPYGDYMKWMPVCLWACMCWLKPITLCAALRSKHSLERPLWRIYILVWISQNIVNKLREVILTLHSAVSSSGICQHERDQRPQIWWRDWSTFPLRKGWESWNCSEWPYQCVQIPEGRMWRWWSQALLSGAQWHNKK